MHRTLMVLLATAATLVGGNMALAKGEDAAVIAQARKFLKQGSSAAAIGPIVVRPPFTLVNFVENSKEHGELLYRRYRFGWQAIGVFYGPVGACDLRNAGVPAADAQVMTPKASGAHDRPETCSPPLSPPNTVVSADEEEVRSLMQAAFDYHVIWVDVAGRYALGTFEDEDGGQALFVKSRAGWKKLTSGGGVMGTGEFIGYGVPAATACRWTGSLTWTANGKVSPDPLCR